MTFHLISLGCDKNLCDSETMVCLLLEAGYEVTDDIALADIIIVNSCSFIGDAQEESINTIIDAGRYKSEGNCKALIVTGCLSQRFREDIKSELPEVDGMLGTASYPEIVSLVKNVVDNHTFTEYFDDISKPVDGKLGRTLSTGGQYAYLKIAEGCNKNCSYCIIPSLRGKYRSIPMEDLIAQAENIALQGVTELILVAQETTLYGIDIYGKKSLHHLLADLSKIDGIKWIRILYCYPEDIYDELIDEIAHNPKVVHYLDMPIQSGSDEILKKMNRLTNRNELVSLINRIRNEIPDIALRTTLITGFPGETSKNHRETLEFIKEIRFDRLGVFKYSREEDTIAGKMSDQVDESIKESRYDELMSTQQMISQDICSNLIGTKLTAFIEGKIVEDNIYVARTYKDAPDVDSYIFISSKRELMSGEFFDVVVTGANEYDLIGETEDEFT